MMRLVKEKTLIYNKISKLDVVGSIPIAAVRVVFDVDVDLSGANAVLESLLDWHLKLIEIGRARWGFTASAAW
jgi:hypothetical protein